ncbi:MAG TPA: ABC transporter permease subunit [Aggregatilineales bacterium]|nr:ABC transporter permease subunit [Aggregatilineales bacterium]
MNAIRRRIIFAQRQPSGGPLLGSVDILILLALAVAVYIGVRLAVSAPPALNGPQINLSPHALPYYALLSTGRMLAAYILSMLFSILYGYFAATNPKAEQIMLPILDVLQSVPILSFLPIVLLGLVAILPQGIAVEIAAVILIFTSQAWNMTYSFYQSMKTLPTELREASAVFRFNWWWRFRKMQLPFSAIGLLWNSVMSWAGGWFFLMAAETFTVGDKDFRLPGLGSYLQRAASDNNTSAILWGIFALVLVVVVLDQFVWRPLLAWADKFKLEMVESDNPPTSWFLEVVHRSQLASWLGNVTIWRLLKALDVQLGGPLKSGIVLENEDDAARPNWIRRGLTVVLLVVVAYGIWRLGALLITVPVDNYVRIGVGAASTFLRVAASLVIALIWTVPLGVAIGSNPRLATILQPVVQIVASIPATALFPVILLALVTLPGGLNVAAILLMLLGTQWYILFNVIAGTTAIPQDLRYTTDLLRFSKVNRWRKLILPALFPYLVTGLITAGGGAWNASIVAEYTTFNAKTYNVTGLGSLISEATAKGDYALLAASTLTMITIVICLNRFFWRRLYRLAEEKYRME